MHKVPGRPQFRNFASAWGINLNTAIAGLHRPTVNPNNTSICCGNAHVSTKLLHPSLVLDSKATFAIHRTRVSQRPGVTAIKRLDLYNLQSGNFGAIWTTHYTIFNNCTSTAELAAAAQAKLGTLIGCESKQERFACSTQIATAIKRPDENGMQSHFMYTGCMAVANGARKTMAALIIENFTPASEPMSTSHTICARQQMEPAEKYLMPLDFAYPRDICRTFPEFTVGCWT